MKKPTPKNRSEIVSTQVAAATLLNCSARTLRNWRAEGCPGFSADGTVDVSKVRAWAAKRLSERRGSIEAKEEKLLEEIRKLRLANDEKEGVLVDVNDVHASADRCLARARAVLVQKFETELPPKQDGMPAERIAELNRAALDEVFAILSKLETYA